MLPVHKNATQLKQDVTTHFWRGMTFTSHQNAVMLHWILIVLLSSLTHKLWSIVKLQCIMRVTECQCFFQQWQIRYIWTTLNNNRHLKFPFIETLQAFSVETQFQIETCLDPILNTYPWVSSQKRQTWSPILIKSSVILYCCLKSFLCFELTFEFNDASCRFLQKSLVNYALQRYFDATLWLTVLT